MGDARRSRQRQKNKGCGREKGRGGRRGTRGAAVSVRKKKTWGGAAGRGEGGGAGGGRAAQPSVSGGGGREKGDGIRRQGGAVGHWGDTRAGKGLCTKLVVCAPSPSAPPLPVNKYGEEKVVEEEKGEDSDALRVRVCVCVRARWSAHACVHAQRWQGLSRAWTEPQAACGKGPGCRCSSRRAESMRCVAPCGCSSPSAPPLPLAPPVKKYGEEKVVEEEKGEDQRCASCVCVCVCVYARARWSAHACVHAQRWQGLTRAWTEPQVACGKGPGCRCSSRRAESMRCVAPCGCSAACFATWAAPRLWLRPACRSVRAARFLSCLISSSWRLADMMLRGVCLLSFFGPRNIEGWRQWEHGRIMF